MSDIGKLKGLTFVEADMLRRSGVATVEALWLRAGKGADEISRLCVQTGISRPRLVELLAADGLRASGRLGDSWLKKHWLDFLMASAILILALLVARAAG